jgi:CMP-N-acetylneuraminic acid synthetase
VPDAQRTLIVIPARGGSKRLPRKNVRPLGGKPLVLHAVDAALKALPQATIVVSTDDPEIKNLAEERLTITVCDRPAALATDTAKNEDVLIDVLEKHPDFDVVGMMLPTCPLRTAFHVRGAFEMLEQGIDAVVSFTEFEFPAQLAVTIGCNSVIQPLSEPSPLVTGNFRSQDQAPSYRPNGAVYFAWTASFRRTRNFYNGKVRGFLMPRVNSVDIDLAEDFAYAEYLVESGIVKP